MSDFFNAAQYEDFRAKSQDLYASTKFDILLDFLKGHGKLRILNGGCGSGELCINLAAAGHRVVGIDPAPEYIEMAEKNLAPFPDLDCRFEVSTIEDYRNDGAFDCVVSTDVLEHIEDDRTAFERLVATVRPGGIVLITVPAGQWLFGYHDEQLGHYRRYSPKTLRRLVQDTCQVKEIRQFGAVLIPICLLFSKWMRRPYPVAQAGDTKKNPLVAWTLRTLLQLERRLPLPMGTSLLLKAVRKEAGEIEVDRPIRLAA